MSQCTCPDDIRRIIDMNCPIHGYTIQSSAGASSPTFGAFVGVELVHYNNLKAERDQLLTLLRSAREALQWADEMFTARDEMNAKVHCSPVRLSPITERVKQAVASIDASGVLK